MEGKGSPGQGAFVGLTGAALIVVVGLPFLFILLQAIFPQIGSGSFAQPFAQVLPVLTESELPRETINSLILGLGTVALSALIALPLATVRGLYRLPGAAVWDVVFLVPFMIPPYIATMGWVMTLQPHGYLQQLTGVNLAGFLFSVPGVIVVLTMNIFPVVYFALSRTFETIGTRYGDVSRVFGATPARTFWRVTLPLAAPGLAGSLLLVFAMAIEEYGTPAVLGARFGFKVLVTGIDGSIADWPVDLPKAALLALVLVALSSGAFLLQHRVLAQHDFTTSGAKPQPHEKRPMGRWTMPVLAGFAAVAVLPTGIPLMAILATALSRTISGGLTTTNMGWQNFAAILGDTSGAVQALLTSLGLGLTTALLAGALGASAAYAGRGAGRGRAVINVLANLPNAAPGVVVALGLILVWNQPALLVTPYNTLGILLLAYVCILLPQPVRYAAAAFRQIGLSLEDAARVSGATATRAAWRILLPLIRPSLLSAMLLVFAVASRELVASLLVVPVGRKTIATFIWRQFDQGSVGVGMAMAFVTICITTLLPLMVLVAARRTMTDI
ncbi:MAG: iron ABC transporter permease [Paracoccaceae bacterium]|nr:iron ABC transporter permease [Paracoccaceae bacterium]